MSDFKYSRSGGRRDFGRSRRRTELHDAVCDKCGKDCKVISQYIVVIVLKEKAEEMVVGLGVEEEIEAWCSWVRKLTL